MPPAVSVLIPAYNGAPWLRACLESVRGQTYPVHEIIVVDDGSTDDTRAVLHPFAPHITLLAQQRGGIGAARNRAVAHASGELLAFLDQDDLWRPDKLEKQVRYAVGRQDVAVIYTDAEEFDDGGTVHPSFFDLFPGLRTSGDLFGPLIDRCIPLMSTTLIRAAFLRAYGLSFFEPASGVDDVGLFLEVCVRGGKFGRLDEPLTRRRLHPNNTSKNHYNRFARRIVLYEELLRRLPEASATHRRELRRGLRDAHFRVGECAWGDLNLTQARQHFRRALGPEAHGARALLCLALSYLPRRALRGLRAVKQRIAPALTTSR